ncbi:hypothetical protein FRUB_07931 [Fimbriiglobus ruber]|uniref:Uncharacterized protein n=1 Tax=Fimbriiglobus ruber TaxID=1908690 RepID=A0A225DI74_9BACT|nr:hypothetical protein FRUB_07931 [Fimbriiglobus ruber]
MTLLIVAVPLVTDELMVMVPVWTDVAIAAEVNSTTVP